MPGAAGVGPAESGVQTVGAQLQLALDRLIESFRSGPGTAGIAAGVYDEVAIGAAGHAERQMDVQGDGRLRFDHSQRLVQQTAMRPGDGGLGFVSGGPG